MMDYGWKERRIFLRKPKIPWKTLFVLGILVALFLLDAFRVGV